MEESSVHGFHVPVIRGKTATGRERLSNQLELRPFLRLQPPEEDGPAEHQIDAHADGHADDAPAQPKAHP